MHRVRRLPGREGSQPAPSDSAGDVWKQANPSHATGSWAHRTPRSGRPASRSTHFSVWTVLDWATSKVAAVLQGALSDIFGPVESGAGVPVCAAAGSSGAAITMSDSHPGPAIGACAQASGQARALAKVSDLRRYPVDLLYPAGTQVSVPSADVFTQIGEDLNNLSASWHDRVLLPGGTETPPSHCLTLRAHQLRRRRAKPR
jgi:hypothetical protein